MSNKKRKLQIKDTKINEFQYIIERKEQGKICFGSGVARNTGPIGKGLTGFMRQLCPEINAKVGPGTYNVTKYGGLKIVRPTSTKKHDGALRNARFKDVIKTSSGVFYDFKSEWTKVKESKNFAFERRPDKPKKERLKNNPIPGPGTYEVAKACRCPRTKFMYNFGSPTMAEAVHMICVSTPVDTCHKCKTLCEGDYWEKNGTIFLCHLCWCEEKNTAEIYNEKELNEFKKIRNCSFMHEHQDTKAHVYLLPPNKVKKKLRLESYLSNFMKC